LQANQAAQLEVVQALEARGAEAKKLEAKLADAHAALDRLALEMAAVIDAAMIDRDQLEKLNVELSTAGRRDLRGRYPAGVMSRLDGINPGTVTRLRSLLPTPAPVSKAA